MKFIITTSLLLVALLVQTVGFAQTRKADQIVKRNNKTIQAIIVEINEKQVLYRDPTKPQTSPPIAIDKSDINKLIYANGQEEKIGGERNPDEQPVAGAKEKMSVFLTGSGGMGVLASPIAVFFDAKTAFSLAYSGGLGVHIPLGSMVAIAPMATYTQFGGKFTDASDATSYEQYNYQSAQLSVPIMFVSPTPVAKFFVGAGPYVNYAFGGQSTTASAGLTESKDLNFAADPNNPDDIIYNPLQFGAMGQLGVKINHFSIFGYYTRSLSSLDNKKELSSASTFGLGLKIHF